MRSRTTEPFRKMLSILLKNVQSQAKKAYQQFKHNPWHNSLGFKQVHPRLPFYSVRISMGYRAVGKLDDKGMLWFWIGSHSDYDNLLTPRLKTL